ncbi:MAG: acyl-CoA dehydrogenase family protein [Pseudoclavibacter sp.]
MTTAPTAPAHQSLEERRPSDYPGGDTLVERARALIPKIREQVELTEQRTTFSEELRQLFIDNDLYRLYVPTRYGGFEETPRNFMRAVMEIARGDMSVGWSWALTANHALQVGSWFPEEAQDIVFGNGDFRAAANYIPGIKATKTDGGYLLNGEVKYASGLPHSTYFMGQAVLDDKNADGSPRFAIVIAPKSSWTIVDDWDRTLGLRGTGSNTVRFENGFLPEALLIPDADMVNYVNPNGSPGWHLTGNHLYAGRHFVIFQMSIASSAIGGAFGALDEFASQLTAKKVSHGDGALRVEDPDYQRYYGSAYTKLRMARAAVLAVADEHLELCRRVAAGEAEYREADDHRISAIAREAMVMAWEVTEELLFRNIGASSIEKTERFERSFRDLAQATTHRFVMLRDPLYRAVAVDLLENPELSQVLP